MYCLRSEANVKLVGCSTAYAVMLKEREVVCSSLAMGPAEVKQDFIQGILYVCALFIFLLEYGTDLIYTAQCTCGFTPSKFKPLDGTPQVVNVFIIVIFFI